MPKHQKQQRPRTNATRKRDARLQLTEKGRALLEQFERQKALERASKLSCSAAEQLAQLKQFRRLVELAEIEVRERANERTS